MKEYLTRVCVLCGCENREDINSADPSKRIGWRILFKIGDIIRVWYDIHTRQVRISFRVLLRRFQQDNEERRRCNTRIRSRPMNLWKCRQERKRENIYKKMRWSDLIENVQQFIFIYIGIGKKKGWKCFLFSVLPHMVKKNDSHANARSLLPLRLRFRFPLPPSP